MFGLLVVTTLILTGCGKVQEPFTVDLSKIKPTTKTNEVTPPSKDNVSVLETPDVIDPTLENLKTPKAIAKSIDGFGIKSSDYVSCLGQAVDNCQQMAIQNEIRKTNSVKPCDYLGDEVAKSSCRNEAWQQIAMADGSIKNCNKIVGDELKLSCVVVVSTQAAVSSGKVSLCAKIESDLEKQQCENRVYNHLAIKNLDVNLCSKLKSDFAGEISMCKDMVEMEQKMKKEEARIKKEESLVTP